MSHRLIFLDLDGVLNDCDHDPSDRPTFTPSCTLAMQTVLAVPGVQFVLSSCWRQTIYNGAYTLEQFELLLRNACGPRFSLLSLTPAESYHDHRGDEIARWLLANRQVESYCVLDDCDDGITKRHHPFVWTDGSTGLTVADAKEVVRILTRTAP